MFPDACSYFSIETANGFEPAPCVFRGSTILGKRLARSRDKWRRYKTEHFGTSNKRCHAPRGAAAATECNRLQRPKKNLMLAPTTHTTATSVRLFKLGKIYRLAVRPVRLLRT